MSEHTPGPWIIEETTDFNASFRVMDVGECTVALCYQQPHDTWLAEDNAKLIAAAPDMLSMLLELSSFLEFAANSAADTGLLDFAEECETQHQRLLEVYNQAVVGDVDG